MAEGLTPWPAPAKINLFLHIVGRRADGYHLLQTLFQFLDHGDTVALAATADGRIRRLNDLPGIPEQADLTVRAARLLQESSGCRQGALLRVDKRIPTGGGLGGGSSDAATVLVGLNHLWRLGLSEDELAALGVRLGADVPVFVRGRAAWAEGIGERLTPVEVPEPWYLVIAPPVSVATPELFRAAELTRDCKPITIRDFLAGTAGACANVFEPVVRNRYPAVAEALDWLDRSAPARLTGSGGCLFAAFEDEEAARRVFATLPDGWRGFVARGRNRSPLLDATGK